MGYGASASGSGRRLVVFVIGGVTRSEMRAAHLVRVRRARVSGPKGGWL